MAYLPADCTILILAKQPGEPETWHKARAGGCYKDTRTEAERGRTRETSKEANDGERKCILM